MKIRRSFVSNSSSCSFCIYGAAVNGNDLSEVLKENGFMEESHENIEDWLYGSEGDKFLEKLGLVAQMPLYDEEEIIYIGRYWKDIPDNSTGKEFKAGVQNTLSQIFKETPICTTYEYAWENR